MLLRITSILLIVVNVSATPGSKSPPHDANYFYPPVERGGFPVRTANQPYPSGNDDDLYSPTIAIYYGGAGTGFEPDGPTTPENPESPENPENPENPESPEKPGFPKSDLESTGTPTSKHEHPQPTTPANSTPKSSASPITPENKSSEAATTTSVIGPGLFVSKTTSESSTSPATPDIQAPEPTTTSKNPATESSTPPKIPDPAPESSVVSIPPDNQDPPPTTTSPESSVTSIPPNNPVPDPQSPTTLVPATTLIVVVDTPPATPEPNSPSNPRPEKPYKPAEMEDEIYYAYDE